MLKNLISKVINGSFNTKVQNLFNPTTVQFEILVPIYVTFLRGVFCSFSWLSMAVDTQEVKLLSFQKLCSYSSKLSIWLTYQPHSLDLRSLSNRNVLTNTLSTKLEIYNGTDLKIQPKRRGKKPNNIPSEPNF